MKLRIRGNTVRIRMTRSEVAELADTGHAEDRVRFSPTDELRYGVAATVAGGLNVEFGASRLLVHVPRPLVDRWLAPTEVSIEGRQPIAGAEELEILVEKDFACLAPRAGEDESDLFENPAAESK